MRVVIVSRIFSPEPSAASFMLEAVARGFALAGHEVEVITTRPPRDMPVAPIPGVRVHRSRVLRDASGYVRGYLPYLSFDVPLALRLLLRRRADVYIVEPPPTTGAVVRVVATLLRRPYIYDAADIWSDAAAMATSSRIVLAGLRAVELFALRGAEHAVAISSHLVERMKELGIHTPTTVIGFGVDPQHFGYLPMNGNGRCFVYAGTFSEWHGAEIFLDAFARFSRVRSGWSLVYLGNGADRPKLERRATELGVPGIEFRDPIPASDLNEVFASATASLASLKPGRGYDYAFTTKVYSSIAAGCPVIFTGVGPTVEFIRAADAERRTGTAVPYAVAAVADAMEELASTPLSREDRRSLSDWARGLYSLRAIADRVVAVAVDMVRRR